MGGESKLAKRWKKAAAKKAAADAAGSNTDNIPDEAVALPPSQVQMLLLRRVHCKNVGCRRRPLGALALE